MRLHEEMVVSATIRTTLLQMRNGNTLSPLPSSKNFNLTLDMPQILPTILPSQAKPSQAKPSQAKPSQAKPS
jgi:hypothetical protein